MDQRKMKPRALGDRYQLKATKTANKDQSEAAKWLSTLTYPATTSMPICLEISSSHVCVAVRIYARRAAAAS